ncbi:hypothetical protein TURU_119790 [Turdus rufiventris]|nr:hypothetical protein TURU_119790 [Turdus rufiventris]
MGYIYLCLCALAMDPRPAQAAPAMGYDSPCQLRSASRKELVLKQQQQQQQQEEEKEEKRLPTHLILEEKELTKTSLAILQPMAIREILDAEWHQ